jgi:hypothetical protein
MAALRILSFMESSSSHGGLLVVDTFMADKIYHSAAAADAPNHAVDLSVFLVQVLLKR